MLAVVEFNADLWRWKCLDDYVCYKTLRELVENEKVVDAHLSSKEILSADGGDIPSQLVEKFHDHERATVGQLLGHFGSQTIVSICTTFEVSVREFFHVWFFEHPDQLHDYVVTGQVTGAVPLQDILYSSDRNELLGLLAARAAQKATQGKYEKIMRRVASHTKSDLPENLDKRLQEVQVLRNRIVHEKESDSGSSDAVLEAQEAVDKAVLYLANIGFSKELPGRYTCITGYDPTHQSGLGVED